MLILVRAGVQYLNLGKKRSHAYLLMLALCATSLSSCNPVGCLKSEDLNYQRVVDTVKGKPDFIDPLDATSYWVKSGARFNTEDGQWISIKPLEINLCSTPDASTVEVSPDKAGTLSGIVLQEGDEITIYMKPAPSSNPAYVDYTKNGLLTIDEDTCQDKYPEAVLVRNKDACKRALGQVYMLKTAPEISDKYPYPNFIYDPNGQAPKKWVKGPYVSFPTSADYQDRPVNVYCSGDPNIEKLLGKNIWPIDMVNKVCKNICHVIPEDNLIVKDNCVITETQQQSGSGSDATSNTYIPGLYGLIKDPESGKMQFLTTITGEIGRGVQTQKGNIITIPKGNLSFYFDPILYSKWKGGVRISVQVACRKKNQESLYYYVGENPPTVRPGDVGTHLILVKGSLQKFTIPANSGSGNVYYGIKDYGDGYKDNTGVFEITSRVPIEQIRIFSYVTDKVSEMVKRVLYGEIDKTMVGKIDVTGAVGNIYRAISQGFFVYMLKAIMLLYIALYAFLYLIGVLRGSYVLLVIAMVKISVMLILLSPNSWAFFNEYLFSWYINGTDELINAMTGAQSKADESTFAFLDTTISRFAYYQTWMQLLGLLLAGPAGWLALFAIFVGVWNLLMALFELIVMYLVSIVMIAMLLAIAPLFIMLILFKKTKAIFDAWIKTLSQLALQPVIAFAAFAMINQLLMVFLYNLLNYDVCSGCVLEFEIEDLLGLCLFRFFLPYKYSPNQNIEGRFIDSYARSPSDAPDFFGIPMSITSLVAFVILCHATQKFVQFVPSMVTSIFSSMGTELSRPSSSVTSSLKGAVGMDEESQGRREQQKSSEKKRGTPEPPKYDAGQDKK